MKKLLLILAITFVSLVDAQELKKAYVLEVMDTPMKYSTNTALFIQVYGFIQTNECNIFQVMREGHDDQKLIPMQPMRCEDYKKTG
mgnify:FL=1